mgnify:CR=1 FL=1
MDGISTNHGVGTMQGILINGDNPGDVPGVWCFDDSNNYLGVIRQCENPILSVKWGHIHSHHKTLSAHQHDIFYCLLKGGYISDADPDTAIDFLREILQEERTAP